MMRFIYRLGLLTLFILNLSCSIDSFGEAQDAISIVEAIALQDAADQAAAEAAAQAEAESQQNSNAVSCPSDTSGLNPAERDAAKRDYDENYLGSAVNNSEWSGSTGGCDYGTVPDEVHNKVIQRINYLRRLVGLNDNCTLDRSWDVGMQKCVLLMDANNNLSHYPDSSWQCYTDSGKSVAEVSNLSQGNHSVNAVMSQIRDRGNNNKSVGHRRWILFSRQLKFAHGSTDNFQALAVINLDFGNTNFPEYHAYPAEGYMPQNLVFDRWSFSVPGLGNDLQGRQISFQNADVTMTGPNGENIELNVIHREKVQADKTIVWEPRGYDKSSDCDKPYTITISGISGARQSSYTYTTILFDPSRN